MQRLVSVMVFALLFVGVIGVAFPKTTSAELLKDACSGSGSDSAVCEDQKNGGADPISGNDGAVMKIVNILAVITGFAAVVIMIVSGLKLITSGGDTQEVATARKSIIYAAIGLIIIILARSIISLVLAKI